MKRYDYDRIAERVTETPAGDYVKYADLAEARALIKKVLGDAGPVENRDATIRQIMEILK